MIRTCDGTDTHLTATVPRDQFNPATMTLSRWDRISYPPHLAVICCPCGLTFDDDLFRVIYPHTRL